MYINIYPFLINFYFLVYVIMYITVPHRPGAYMMRVMLTISVLIEMYDQKSLETTILDNSEGDLRKGYQGCLETHLPGPDQTVPGLVSLEHLIWWSSLWVCIRISWRSQL